MEKLSHIIEKLYQSFILNTDEHYFLTNVDYTLKINKNIQKSFSSNLSQINIPLNKNPLPDFPNETCRQEPTETMNKDFFIDTYFKLIKNAHTPHQINTLLDNSLKYLLPATISSKENLKKFLEEKKDINILIYGGGPSGLFIACYLTYLFNSQYSKTSFPQIKVLLVDNRSPKTGYRFPFNRERVFYVGSDFFKLLLSDILCLYKKNNNFSSLIKIKYLEQMLYLWAIKNNIPMYFDPQAGDEKFIKNLIQKGNFNLFFDCTGNRLPNIFWPKITPKDKLWLNHLSLKPSNLKKYFYPNKIGQMVIKNNQVKYQFKTPEAKYYLFIEPFLNGQIYPAKSDLVYNITHKKDIEILKKLSGKCLSYQNYQSLISHLHSHLLRKMMTINCHILKENVNLKLYLLDLELFHKIKITQIHHLNNHQYLYIGLGDSIFSGHFVVGQGLARLIPLIDKIVHLIPML